MPRRLVNGALVRGAATDERAKQPASPEERRHKRDPVTHAEVREQQEFVEKLLLSGVSKSRILKECRKRFGIGDKRAISRIDRVRQTWIEEERASRPSAKAAATQRLLLHVAKAAADKQWSAVAQLERLLSDVQGTKEAIEINVNVDATVTEAAMHVVSSLTREQMQEVVAQQRQLRAEAAKWRALASPPPQDRPVVTVAPSGEVTVEPTP